LRKPLGGLSQSARSGVTAKSYRMQSPLNFAIRPSCALCEQLLARGLSTFDQLAEYVQSLPYGRTGDATDPLAVIQERRGTCSSKHQLLSAVAHECGHFEVQLTVGIYDMSEQNTPGVGVVLNSAQFFSIPEAHCYLTVGGERFDFTGLSSGRASPFDTLRAEYAVSPAELTQMKGRLHRRALTTWASALGISMASAWAIRERCIAALADKVASIDRTRDVP
jgi:hypothetical protein